MRWPVSAGSCPYHLWAGSNCYLSSDSDFVKAEIETLVNRCQEGQLEAFTTLFGHFKNQIHDLAHTILRDEGGAEDVVQDTFLAVFQKIDGFRGDSAFETWLTAIAVNECRMRLRKRKVRQLLSLEQLSPRHLFRLSGRKRDVADWD